MKISTVIASIGQRCHTLLGCLLSPHLESKPEVRTDQSQKAQLAPSVMHSSSNCRLLELLRDVTSAELQSRSLLNNQGSARPSCAKNGTWVSTALYTELDPRR